MSASDKSPSLESNGNATGAEALKLLERVYPYIRHDPECPSTLDRGCECPVSILREQIEDLIATQHAPPVGPGNEAGATEQKGSHGIIVPQRPPPDVVSILREFVNGIYGYTDTGVWPDNHTLRTWAENGKDALEGIGKFIEPTGTAADSVGQRNENQPASLLSEKTEIERLSSELEQAREALENAGNALKICYADSHAIRTEWLRENDLDAIANVVDNIRRWSGSHHNEIRLALLLSKKAGDSPVVSVSSEDPPAASPRPERKQPPETSPVEG